MGCTLQTPQIQIKIQNKIKSKQLQQITQINTECQTIEKGKFPITSKILLNSQHVKFFQKQIIKKMLIQQRKIIPKEITNIFTASQHAFQASHFHNKTNGYKNTILLVRTQQQKVFGGFTVCKWKKDQLYKYQTDEKGLSFLFSLKKVQQDDNQNNQVLLQKKISMNDKSNDEQKKSIITNNTNNKEQISKCKKKKNEMKRVNRNESQQKKVSSCYYYQTYKVSYKKKAIMNHCDAGPIFGEGHDIFIANQCNKNSSWCNIGKTYSSLQPFGSIKANKELCGQEKFIIQDYQIWHLKLQNERK